MSTEQFSMDDLKKRIEKNVIANMGMLMPEEALTKLVNEAIERFFSSTENFTVTRNTDWGYSASKVPNVKCEIKCSTFEMMVWNTILPIVQKNLEQLIEDHNGEMTKALDVAAAKVNDSLKTLTLQNAVTMTPVIYEYRMLNTLNETMTTMMKNIHQTLVLNRLQTGMLVDPNTRTSLDNSY